MEAIYVDHAATSPVHPDVTESMLAVLKSLYGNPSSIHRFGRETRAIVDEARREIAKTIAAKDNEIVFTSGGTEANNTAIIGVAFQHRNKGNHIITTEIEHHSVLHPYQYLEKHGFNVTYLPVDKTGKIALNDVKHALTDDTILVSVMYGNNEVGTLQPIETIGKLLKEKDIYFHTDAVQAYGLIDIDVNRLNVDLLSVSAHKINGPKGIGFLYVRDGVKLSPLIHGGEQERKRRAGTENVAGIVGFQTAARIMKETMQERKEKYERFRSIMLEHFKASGIDYVLNGHETEHLPHILNVSFPGTTAEAMLVNLDLAGVAASSGSACTAGSLEPSHVLAAMFNDDEEKERIMSAIRFSFGLGNTNEEIEKAAEETVKAVKRITGR